VWLAIIYLPFHNASQRNYARQVFDEKKKEIMQPSVTFSPLKASFINSRAALLKVVQGEKNLKQNND